jgi:hypothetical protein
VGGAYTTEAITAKLPGKFIVVSGFTVRRYYQGRACAHAAASKTFLDSRPLGGGCTLQRTYGPLKDPSRPCFRQSSARARPK